MKKNHSVMSGFKCQECGKNLKQNLVDKKEHPNLVCYKCFRVHTQGKPAHHQPRKKRLVAELPTH